MNAADGEQKWTKEGKGQKFTASLDPAGEEKSPLQFESILPAFLFPLLPSSRKLQLFELPSEFGRGC